MLEPNIEVQMKRKRFVMRAAAGVIAVMLAACDLMDTLPSGIQIKATPGLYLPLGDPLTSMTDEEGNPKFLDIGSLADIEIPADAVGDMGALYDYQAGEYKETMAYVIHLNLITIPFEDALPDLPDFPSASGSFVSFALEILPGGGEFEIPSLPGEDEFDKYADWKDAVEGLVDKNMLPDDLKDKDPLTWINDPDQWPDDWFTEDGQAALPPDLFPTTMKITPPSMTNKKEDGTFDPEINVDMANLTSVLQQYGDGGLEFDKLPAYIYVNGPSVLLSGGPLQMTLEALKLDETGKVIGNSEQLISPNDPVVFCPLPDFPESDGELIPVMPNQLSPTPETKFDLAALINACPQKLGFQYTIKSGEISITRQEYADLKKESLSLDMVLIIPLKFNIKEEIPVLAGEGEKGDDGVGFAGPAISISDTDLFGRGGADDEGSMGEVFKRLQSIALDVTVINDLGLNGYARMINGDSTLGTLKLSGKSTIQMTRKQVETLPFSPKVAVYLSKGILAIKRTAKTANSPKPLPEDEAPKPPPLRILLAATIYTSIDEEF
jgi:hypothetical protein